MDKIKRDNSYSLSNNGWSKRTHDGTHNQGRGVWGEDQVGHIYTRFQRDSVGQTLLRADDFDLDLVETESTNKVPEGDVCRLTTIMTEDGERNDTALVIINVANETIAYTKHYDFDDDNYGDLTWARPYKYKELVIQDLEYYESF